MRRWWGVFLEGAGWEEEGKRGYAVVVGNKADWLEEGEGERGKGREGDTFVAQLLGVDLPPPPDVGEEDMQYGTMSTIYHTPSSSFASSSWFTTRSHATSNASSIRSRLSVDTITPGIYRAQHPPPSPTHHRHTSSSSSQRARSPSTRHTRSPSSHRHRHTRSSSPPPLPFPHHLTSAKSGVGVADVFDAIALWAVHHQHQHEDDEWERTGSGILHLEDPNTNPTSRCC